MILMLKFAFALLLVVTFGCSQADNDGKGAGGADGTTASTEGKRSLFGTSGAQWVEDLRLDGNDLDLVHITALRVAHDGTIVVLQPQAFAIRFFDASGRPLGSVGRQGGGPGEFQLMAKNGWMGDTLWVSDATLKRISLFTPDRQFVRDISLGIARPAAADVARFPQFGFVDPRAVYTDGSMLATAGSGRYKTYPASYDRNAKPWLRVSRDYVIQAQIGWVPEDNSFARLETATGVGGFAIPFAIAPYDYVSPDGSRIAILTTDTEGEHKGTFQVTVLGQAGDTVFSRRYPFKEEPIPGSVLDSAMTARIKNLQERFPGAVAAMRKAKVPTVYPPVSRFFLAQDSTVWVRLRQTGDLVPWVILSPRGEPVDTLRLPPTLRPVEASNNQLYLIERDENDVESILRFRLHKKN
jgi:hypothetical protein